MHALKEKFSIELQTKIHVSLPGCCFDEWVHVDFGLACCFSGDRRCWRRNLHEDSAVKTYLCNAFRTEWVFVKIETDADSRMG